MDKKEKILSKLRSIFNIRPSEVSLVDNPANESNFILIKNKEGKEVKMTFDELKELGILSDEDIKKKTDDEKKVEKDALAKRAKEVGLKEDATLAEIEKAEADKKKAEDEKNKEKSKEDLLKEKEGLEKSLKEKDGEISKIKEEIATLKKDFEASALVLKKLRETEDGQEVLDILNKLRSKPDKEGASKEILEGIQSINKRIDDLEKKSAQPSGGEKNIGVSKKKESGWEGAFK